MELHETVRKEVIRAIQIDLGLRHSEPILGSKGYFELVGHSDGTLSRTPKK